MFFSLKIRNDENENANKQKQMKMRLMENTLMIFSTVEKTLKLNIGIQGWFNMTIAIMAILRHLWN